MQESFAKLKIPLLSSMLVITVIYFLGFDLYVDMIVHELCWGTPRGEFVHPTQEETFILITGLRRPCKRGRCGGEGHVFVRLPVTARFQTRSC